MPAPENHEACPHIRSFLGSLLVITLALESLVALASRWQDSLLFLTLAHAVTWSPAMAAFVASRRCRRPLFAIGFGWPKWQTLAIGYTLPLAYSLIIYGIVWTTGLGHFYNSAHLDHMVAALGFHNLSTSHAFLALALIYPTVIFLEGCASSLGEEIGWRGFLLPELIKIMSFPKAAFLSGLVWAVWHYPLIIFGGYHGHSHLLYSLGCFTAVIIALSFPLSWLRLRSGSVWPCTFFHASHNLFMLKLFNPLTVDTGPTRWLVSEFGILTVLVTVAMAWMSSRPALGGRKENGDAVETCMND